MAWIIVRRTGAAVMEVPKGGGVGVTKGGGGGGRDVVGVVAVVLESVVAFWRVEHVTERCHCA